MDSGVGWNDAQNLSDQAPAVKVILGGPRRPAWARPN